MPPVFPFSKYQKVRFVTRFLISFRRAGTRLREGHPLARRPETSGSQPDVARPPAPGDARAFLTFNHEAAVRHHAFGVKGQQSGENGARRVSPAAAVCGPSDSLRQSLPSVPPASTVTRISPPSDSAPAPPLPRAKPRPLRRRGACPTAPARRWVCACATCRPPAAPTGMGRAANPPRGRGLRFPAGRASRCPRRPERSAPQPAERSRTTFPVGPCEPAPAAAGRATADSASRRAARGGGAAGRGRVDAGGPDVRPERRSAPGRARPAASRSRGRAARGLARRPPWR